MFEEKMLMDDETGAWTEQTVKKMDKIIDKVIDYFIEKGELREAIDREKLNKFASMVLMHYKCHNQ
jgi:hypothetical protein